MSARTALLAFLVVVVGVSLAIIIAGCAAYEDRVTDVGKMLSPVDERVIHGDTDFTPAERAAAEQACWAWTSFTRGRVRLTMRWDLDGELFLNPPGPALYRVGPRSDYTGGWTEDDRMWWVPSICKDMQACMMHEIGHMLGLCLVDKDHPERDPHLPPGNVMTLHNPPHVFGAADYRECLRVGVCRPPSVEYTTVTVTVDPSIPNVQPDYPAETYRP